MKRIIVATDFSERSDRALRRATLLARRSGADILLAHFVDDDQPANVIESARKSATDLLRDQAATVSLMDGVACKSLVLVATPSAGILEATQSYTPDLIVLGRNRRQPLRESFVGTTAERIIRAATCPVLVAKAPPVGPYRRILLAADLSDGCRMAFESFAAIELAGDAKVSALHVCDAPATALAMSRMLPPEVMQRHLGQEREAAERALQAFTDGLNVPIDERIVRQEGANPAGSILEVAEKIGAGLIVAGTRGRSGLGKLLLGSVVAEILREAQVDVLVAPPRRP
ncbi:MAG: universal stress protein [Reyranellaceae bacterium]